jgi:NADPH:quinone reductase-like Zn-dependent oxidoreductase
MGGNEPRTMRAIVCTRYGPPEVLQIKEMEKPTPKGDEVCIKIHATSITHSDIIVRGFKVHGGLRFLMGLAIGFSKPRDPILGMTLAGEVESTGKAAERFKKGDQVYGVTIKSAMHPRLGTYAEYKCLPDDSYLVSKPSNVTYEEAAVVPYGGLIALFFIKKAELKSGQEILVYGASGSIGTSIVQLAKYFGAKVTGVCSTSNLELVKSLGADTVIDYTKEDFTDTGKFYDVIFDAVPSGLLNRKGLKSKCKKALTSNGKYISVDDGRPKFSIEGLVLLNELLETGKIKPVVDKCYPLEQIVEAHRYVDLGHKKGNVAVTVSHNEGRERTPEARS